MVILHRLCKFFVLQILQDKNVKKMIVTNIHLPDLKTGSCKDTVDTRLLCFWEAINVKKGEELMGVEVVSFGVKGRKTRN